MHGLGAGTELGGHVAGTLSHTHRKKDARDPSTYNQWPPIDPSSELLQSVSAVDNVEDVFEASAKHITTLFLPVALGNARDGDRQLGIR